MMVRWIAYLVCVCGMTLSIGAQTPPWTTTAYRQAVLFQGPDVTYAEAGVLAAGVEITLLERNAVGHWLRIERRDGQGQVAQAGWLMIGVLNLPAELRLSALPISEAPDFAPENVRSQSMQALYRVPLLPRVTEATRAIFMAGQTLGNQAAVVTKVGDSVVNSPMYLTPLAAGGTLLGVHDDLAATVDFFAAGLGEPSVAAQVGMTSYTIFDPFWADKALCQANETPLACEYRRKRPAFAVVGFGPNDVRHMTDVDFAVQMRLLIETSQAAGVVPLLTTFSVNPESDLWWQSVNFNLRLTELAAEYGVPLMNFWAAARSLPDYGLDQDGIHMLQSGYDVIKFDAGLETWNGATLQNLVTLRALEVLHRDLVAP